VRVCLCVFVCVCVCQREGTGVNVGVSGETGVRSLRWREAQEVAQLTVMIGTIFFLLSTV
jgi:hypothetical protein